MRIAVVIPGVLCLGPAKPYAVARWARLSVEWVDYTQCLAQELSRRGHEVVFIDAALRPGHGGSDAKHAAPVRSRFRGLRGFARWAGQKVADGRFDASLSLTTAVPATLVLPWDGTHAERARRTAAAAGALRRFPTALTQRVRPASLSALCLERRTLREEGVRRYLATSAYLRRQLVEGGHLPAERVAVIAATASAEEEIGDERQRLRAVLRERLGLTPGQVVYLFRSLTPRLDGLGSVLAALRRVVDSGVDGVLLLAGRTQWRHERALISLGMRPRVRFLGQTSRMPAVYAAADVTVAPTYCDARGRVVLDSLLRGVPAVTSAYSGAVDFLEDAEGRPRGRLVAEPRDIAGLAAAMRELADPEARRQCRTAMGGLAESLSIPRHVDGLLEALAG